MAATLALFVKSNGRHAAPGSCERPHWNPASIGGRFLPPVGKQMGEGMRMEMKSVRTFER